MFVEDRVETANFIGVSRYTIWNVLRGVPGKVIGLTLHWATEEVSSNKSRSQVARALAELQIGILSSVTEQTKIAYTPALRKKSCLSLGQFLSMLEVSQTQLFVS